MMGQYLGFREAIHSVRPEVLNSGTEIVVLAIQGVKNRVSFSQVARIGTVYAPRQIQHQ